MEPIIIGNQLDPENITIKTEKNFYELLDFLEANHLSDNIESQYEKPLPKVMEDTKIVFSFIKGHDKLNADGSSLEGEYIFHFVTFNTFKDGATEKRQMFCLSFKNIIALLNYCHNIVRANQLTTENITKNSYGNPVLALLAQAVQYIRESDMYSRIVLTSAVSGTAKELENLILISEKAEKFLGSSSSVEVIDKNVNPIDKKPDEQPTNTSGLQALLGKLGTKPHNRP